MQESIFWGLLLHFGLDPLSNLRLKKALHFEWERPALNKQLKRR